MTDHDSPPFRLTDEIAALMQLSSRQVERMLAALKSEGTITRQGSPKGGWWEISEEQKKGRKAHRINPFCAGPVQAEAVRKS